LSCTATANQSAHRVRDTAEVDDLARAVRKAAPHYVNYDHYHFNRVEKEVKALKNRISSAPDEVDRGGQPMVVVEFLEKLLRKAIDMDQWNVSIGGQPMVVVEFLEKLLRKAIDMDQWKVSIKATMIR